MPTTGRSPARESYAYQRQFHKPTWSSATRGTVARFIPAEWRQRLRLRRRLELAGEYAFDGVDFLLGRRKELIPPRHLNFVGHGTFEATGEILNRRRLSRNRHRSQGNSLVPKQHHYPIPQFSFSPGRYSQPRLQPARSHTFQRI